MSREARGCRQEDVRLRRAFDVEAERLIEDHGVGKARASRDLDVHENVLRKGGGNSPSIQRRLSGLRAEEAGAAGDREAAAGGRQSDGGARHPERGRSPLREEGDMRFAFITRRRRICPAHGCANRWKCLGLASMLGSPGRRAGTTATMKRSAPRRGRVSSGLPAPMAHGASARRVGGRHQSRASPHRAPDAGAGPWRKAASACALKEDGRLSAIASNTLDREFHAERPNQHWSAVFTCDFFLACAIVQRADTKRRGVGTRW